CGILGEPGGFSVAKEARGMGAATRFDTQQVGALPVSTQYLARWGLADAVNDLVPWEGEVPSGTPAEVLIANRLLRPPALFRVDQWAQSAAAADYFDPERGQLNDGRPGRALERLAAHAGRTQAALVLAATREFEPDV